LRFLFVGHAHGVSPQTFERLKKPSPILVLLLLASATFSLATVLQPSAMTWSQAGQDNVLKVLLGDGRRLFANHFFVKADIYFHSGYYPSIFYQGRRESGHMAGGHDDHPQDEHDGHNPEKHPADEKNHAAHEEEADFLGEPRDWIERIGRQFMITEHTHLEKGQEREILPWLKLSAELDPHRTETYTVAAFWLANQLHKIPEAEQFLREGLRANPGSYEILFSLGRLYYENQHDVARARNVWELAARRWQEQEQGKKEPDKLGLEQIVMNLANLEEHEKRFAPAIAYLEVAKQLSPAPAAIQKQIDDLRTQFGPSPATATRTP